MVTLFSRQTLWPVLVLTAAVVTPTGRLSAAPDDQLLADVRAAWEATGQSVKTVRIAWVAKDLCPKGSFNLMGLEGDGKVRPPEDFRHEDKVTLLLDGTKARFTFEGMIWNEPALRFQKQVTNSAFLDEKYTGLRQYETQPYPSGVINKASWNTDCDISTWPAWAAFRGTEPKVMRGTYLGRFTSARRTALGGRPMVELVRERTPTRGEAKVWVDPAKSYAVERYDEYGRDGALQSRITVTNRKDSSGLWVPSSWSAVAYRQKKLVRSVDVTVRELVINPPTTPDDFRITFPPGTWVVDSTGPQSREYLVREGAGRRDILPEERVASYDDLLRTDAGELEPGGRPSFTSRNRAWVIAAGLLLVIGAMVVLLLRRANRARFQAGGAPGPIPSQEEPK